ncbi:hypothetical protein [Nocardia sp. NPDC060249]|uniref:hypothetical protein n=1 Tax=Nocardia sp. NPDC060249 TaxID=3347082 RepID=UPI0036628796
MTDHDHPDLPRREPRDIDEATPGFYYVTDPVFLRRVVAGLQAPAGAPLDSTESQSSYPDTELKEESPCTR